MLGRAHAQRDHCVRHGCKLVRRRRKRVSLLLLLLLLLVRLLPLLLLLLPPLLHAPSMPTWLRHAGEEVLDTAEQRRDQLPGTRRRWARPLWQRRRGGTGALHCRGTATVPYSRDARSSGATAAICGGLPWHQR